jgi:hypothetical protein
VRDGLEFPGQGDEPIGFPAHRGNHHHDLVAGCAEFCYAPGDIFYALGAANRSTAVFLNKKSHNMYVSSIQPAGRSSHPRSCETGQPLERERSGTSRHSMPDQLTLKKKWKYEADNFNRLQQRKLNYMQ